MVPRLMVVAVAVAAMVMSVALSACRATYRFVGDDVPSPVDTVDVPAVDVAAGDVADVDGADGGADLGDGAAPPAVLHVTLGNGHTCALLDGGAIDCWGRNDHGQLGDGTTTPRANPVPVSSVTGAISVVAGALHTCAIVGDGGTWCWGANAQGQLGDGTVVDRAVATAVQGLPTPAVQLALGAAHTCARTMTNQVWCWGANDHGQLGAGGIDAAAHAVPTMAMTGGSFVAGGDGHVCVRQGTTTDGFYSKCWGANGNGQLGDGTTADRGTPAVTMIVTDGARGGGRHTCALHPTGASSGMSVVGDLVCDGANDAGQLGDGTNVETHRPTAYPMLTAGQLITSGQVALGGDHTCLAGVDGSLHCWGRNDFGELGDGTTTSRNAPAFIGNLPGVAEVALGAHHTCVVSTANTLLCWGANTDGEVGDGTTVMRTRPVPVLGWP